jgi:hypothetical protein
MRQPDSLTISAPRGRSRVAFGIAVLSALLLAGCTIEVGPPPESDPPLVPESAKAPPPPPQPTEPQAWSRDLDLESGPTTIDRRQLAEGLVASDSQGQYSEQRLTFQSAFEEQETMSEAERLRQRALERAKAAGLPPPPEVSAAPVAAVSAQSLDEAGEATPATRQSRLPPPPKFPPLPSESAAAEASTAGEAPAGEGPTGTGDATEMAADDPALAAGTALPETQGTAPQQPSAQRQSRLPPPPKFPPLPAQNVAPETAAGPGDLAPEAASEPALVSGTQLASKEGGGAAAQAEPGAPGETAKADPTQVAAAPGGPPAEAGQAEAASFAAAWDAPRGTILVQVAAVTDAAKVGTEWQRLQASFPEVLQPLRLVVEPAMLGERAAFYRVQAGGFASEAGAGVACDTLISAGQSCFVVVR